MGERRLFHANELAWVARWGPEEKGKAMRLRRTHEDATLQ